MVVALPAAPQGTTLHSVLASSYPSWLTSRQADDDPVCYPVRQAIERFLGCNDPVQGYALFACPGCDYQVAIPLPCNGRGWCPSCQARRMRKCGSWMVQRVFGDVPVRHWVMCLPPQIKQTIGYDPAVLNAVLKCFVRKVFQHLRRKARDDLRVSLKHSRPAAISVIHFASSDLTPNTHFHCVVVDGVFAEDADGNAYLWQLGPPSVKDIAEVARLTCRAICRMLAKRGLWRKVRSRKHVEEGVLLFGGEQPAKFFGDASYNMEGGAAPRDGAHPFHVWAGHHVEPGDREGLQELVYYVLAPLLRYEQISLDAKGNIVLRLKRPQHDGTQVVVFTPHEFLDALAELIPRKRKFTIRYHGAYASASKLRARAVQPADKGKARPAVTTTVDGGVLRKVRARYPDRYPTCPGCSSPMMLIAMVTPGFEYRNPYWIEPDHPPVAIPPAFKTAGSDPLTFVNRTRNA